MTTHSDRGGPAQLALCWPSQVFTREAETLTTRQHTVDRVASGCRSVPLSAHSSGLLTTFDQGTCGMRTTRSNGWHTFEPTRPRPSLRRPRLAQQREAGSCAQPDLEVKHMSTSSQQDPTYVARIMPGHIEILASWDGAERQRVDEFEVPPGRSLRRVLLAHKWRIRRAAGFVRRGQYAGALFVDRVKQ